MTTPSETINWQTFIRGLAVGFGHGCIDDAVILKFADFGHVQYAQAADTITVEVSDLDGAPLTQQQRNVLTVRGWDPPGEHGNPNWAKIIAWRPDPQLFDATAQMITGVLRDVVGLRSPQQMEVEAFNIAEGDQFHLPFTGPAYELAALSAELRQADLRLHETAAASLIAKEVPGAQVVAVVAMAADHRPTRTDAGEYYVDRVLYVGGDDPHILIWSHVGPSGRTGSRLVPPHPPVDGPYIRAEQGSTVYVRDLLQRNKTLAAALDMDRAMRARMSDLLATGRTSVVRAERVAVNTSGAITVMNMTLASDELDVATLRLAACLSG